MNESYKKGYNLYINNKLHATVDTRKQANEMVKELKKEGDHLDKYRIVRCTRVILHREKQPIVRNGITLYPMFLDGRATWASIPGRDEDEYTNDI